MNNKYSFIFALLCGALIIYGCVEKNSPKKESDAKCFTNSLGMKFVNIPKGSIFVGSTVKEVGHNEDEIYREINLKNDFFMQTTEVTQEQWKKMMGENPSFFNECGKECPVENISWDDVNLFIKKLSLKENKIYRLPTQIEWEYACRAGTKTPFYFGECLSTDLANFNGLWEYDKCKKGKYRKKTMQVGSFPPNKWGLYEMHGNVWEWCQDIDENQNDIIGVIPKTNISLEIKNIESYKIIKGGGWDSAAENCRSASKDSFIKSVASTKVGFRLVYVNR